MKTKGRKTTIEHIDVEVDACSILLQIYKNSIPIGMDYIGSDGFWYKKEGYDYHKREDLYEKSRAATEDEMKLEEAYLILSKYASEERL